VDSDFRLDIAEVNRSIEGSEVIALYFPLLRKTLLMDSRTSRLDGPMIRVVPMASSPEERFRSLMQLRPRFARPDSITIIPWPKYVRSLRQLGVWEHIVRKFAETGYPEAVRQGEAALHELLALEAAELRRAITGENYRTIWGSRGVNEADDPDDEEEDDEEEAEDDEADLPEDS
jgi:hypothetical protein